MRAEQTAREMKTLNIGATGSMELRNISGDITVTAGWDETSRSRSCGSRADAPTPTRKPGSIRVKVSVTQQGERAQVQTEYPEERQAPYSVSVSYAVTAPAGTRVTINGVSGDVVAKGMQGQMSVKSDQRGHRHQQRRPPDRSPHLLRRRDA